MVQRPAFTSALAAARRRPAVWRHRLVAAGAVGLVAFAAGVVMGAGHEPAELAVAERYVRAWERQDYTAMYAMLDDASRRRVDGARFAALHREALATATATRLRAGRPVRVGDGLVRVGMVVATRVFGVVRAPVRLRIAGDGPDGRIEWRRALTFPGVPTGGLLTRALRMPPRGRLLTRDGRVLAAGPGRQPDSDVADVAGQTVGQLGPIPPARAAELGALGVPEGTEVGLTGLERALDRRLLGRPGGELLAGGRVLARSAPVPAGSVRTTVAPAVVRAAVSALAGRLGGVVALDPRNGEVLGFAGIAFSGLQPPGSTFKIITLTAGLQAGITRPSKAYPVQTEATLEGVSLGNANGEACGGTLAHSFAESCNSVFAPLGAALGAARLVTAAERFGFNAPPGIDGAATSSLPPASEIGDDLAVGSTAIGQGRVQASALQMALVAAAIAQKGRRVVPTLDRGAVGRAPVLPAATTPRVARTVQRLMLGVVREGTGTNAAIPGVPVAGKTGTAELKTTRRCVPEPQDPEACPDDQAADPTDTDAWFAAFAPAGRRRSPPRVAVGVLVVQAGAGGDTAAPVARQVLQAALKR